MKKIQTQPKHANKLMQKWEDDRMQKKMSNKVRGAKSSIPDEDTGSKCNAKASPVKGAQNQRRRRMPAKKLDEEINAGLETVLNGMSKRRPRKATTAAAPAKRAPVSSRKPIVIRTPVDADEVSDEDPYLDEEWETEGPHRQGPIPRTESVASSIQEEADVPPLTPAEEPVHFGSRARSRAAAGSPPQSDKDMAILSQSITQLHALVNAKIKNMTKRMDSPNGSKIPGAPVSRVRPVSANTMARTRIPRPGSGSPSPAASPAKAAPRQNQAQATERKAAPRNGSGRTLARTVFPDDKAGASTKASPNSKQRQPELPADRSRGNGTPAQAITARAGAQPALSPPETLLTNGDNRASPTGDRESGESSGSISGTSSRPTLSRLGSGLRDSTEIGLGEALEIAVEGSRIFNADLDAFKSKMQREDASTPCLNSTDHLLDAFLKNGHLNSTESTDDAGDYSADDFEDVEVVEEDFDMSSEMTQRELSMQAEALFGSLHQLHALMASPGMSRRGTGADDACLSDVAELEDQEESDDMLNPTRLSMACSILEESLRVS